MSEPLDGLPLELLMALRDAMTDPGDEGRERARLRALDAGFHLDCSGSPAPRGPMEMPPADADATAVHLVFSAEGELKDHSPNPRGGHDAHADLASALEDLNGPPEPLST